jgi:holliday junction DNA helicase RuvA
VLYGFSDAAERDWFRLLTTVQGVGGKVALGILSTLSPSELIAAIAAGDKASLSRAPGVGPRLAVRLATELKDKTGAMPTMPGVSYAPVPVGSLTDDVLSALINLGYRRAEALPIVTRTIDRLGTTANFDAIIRDCLRNLAQRAIG